MAQEVIVPVKVLLENLLNIAKEMHTLLGTLKVDSSGYKKLENVIIDIEKRIQSLQVMSARPFINGKLFNDANKEIIHIQDDLSKIRIEANKIKFSDLSLDGSLKAKLLEFDEELKTINDALKLVKDSAKDTFFSSEIGKAWKIDHPKDAGKSFAEITKIIELEVAKLEGALEKAEKAQKDYRERVAAQRQLTSFIKSGHELSKENLGEKLYNLIFDKNSNFKAGGRNLLQTWLQELFRLPPSVAEDLVKDTGKKVLEAFALANDSVEKTLKQEKNRIGANLKDEKTNTNNGKTYASNVTLATTELNASRAVKQLLSETNLQLAKTEETLGKLYNETKEAREAYTLSLTRLAIGALQDNSASTAMVGQLQSLQQELNVQQSKILKYDQAASKLLGISNFVNRYVGAYAIIRKVSTAIRDAFNNIQELDKVITSIAVVTNMSQEDLWNKVGLYTDMALQYGVATKDVYTVSLIFYQQGLLTAQVMDLTTETLKMAKIAGMEYGAAANAMTVAVRAFKIEMSDALSVTDAYSALAAKFAVSSAEIANAMEKTASSAASVGMSLESTSAFISVMEQTTRESAQNIGSALKSIISRYGEMKASPDKLINVDGEEVAFNKVDTALSSIGISIKDAAGQFRDFDDVIMELAAKWNTLDNNTQRYIATVMAGNRQQSRFIALVSNYDELNRAMLVASNSENASIVQVAKTMDSLETKTNLLKNAFSLLYLDLHIEAGLKNIYDILTRIITTVGKLGTFNGAIASLTNIVGFGFGAKSLFSNVSEIVRSKRDDAGLRFASTLQKIDEINAELAKPVEKDVTLNVNRASDEVLTALEAEKNILELLTLEILRQTEAEREKAVVIQQNNELANEREKNVNEGAQQSPVSEQDTEKINALVSALLDLKTARELANEAKKAGNKEAEKEARTMARAAAQQARQLGVLEAHATNGNVDELLLQKQLELDVAIDPNANQKITDELEKNKPVVSVETTAANPEKPAEDVVNASGNTQVNVLTNASNPEAPIEEVKATTEGQSVKVNTEAATPEKPSEEVLAATDGNPIEAPVTAKDETLPRTQVQDDFNNHPVLVSVTTENTEEKAPGKIRAWFSDKTNLRRAIGIGSSILRMGGTALAGYGASIQDKSTDTLNGQGIERSKIWTGIGNGLSSAGTGMSLGMMTGNPLVALAGGVVGFLAGGIGAIIDGLHMSLDERLELEKKEAKEKSDAALKELAKATDISSSIDNIKLLQKAMYNSADDMKAYKDAMNTLGLSYPELISTYDSMGNAVIDLQSAEETLIAVRAQASDSALEAAEAEMKARHTLSEIWEDSLNKINEILNNPIQHGASAYSRILPTYLPTDLSDTYTFSSILNISSLGMDKILLELIKNTLNYTDIDKNSDIGKTMTNILLRRIPTIEGAEIGPLVSFFLNNLNNQQIWSGPEQKETFQKFFNAHPVVTGHDNAISNEQAELLYGDTEKLESELNTILTKIAPSLGLSENITARQFFGWDEEGTLKLTLTLLEAAKALLDLKISGALNNTKILDSAVARGYAEKGLNNALKLSDINTEDKLKISNNSIFTSLITRGLEVAANKAGAESASSWATDPKTKDAFNQARTNLIEQFMEDILNIDLNKFLAGTSDLTQYLNEDDLFAAAGITDKDSSLAQELALLFAQDNLANRNRILNLIYKDKGYNKLSIGKIINLKNGTDILTNISTLFEKAEDGSSLILSKYSDYFISQLLEINKLAEKGYTTLATNRLSVLNNLADALGEIDSSKEQQDLFSIITSTDFTNLDSLLNAQKAIKLYRAKNNITSGTDGTYLALLAIQEAEKSLIFNVNTLAENLSSSISEAAKSIDSILSSNHSGLDLSKALEGLKSLNVGKSAKEAFNFNDIFRFDATLGKYVYTVKGLKAAIALVEGNLNEQVTRLKEMQELYQSNLISEKESEEFLSSYLFKDASSLLGNISGYRNWNTQTLILYQGLAEDFMKASEYTEKTWENFVKYILERKKTGDLAVEASELQLAAYKANKPNQLFLNIDWASLALKTDYSGTNQELMQQLAIELGLMDERTGEWVRDKTRSWETVVDEYLNKLYGINDSAAKRVARAKINDDILKEKISNYLTALSEILNNSNGIISLTSKELARTTGIDVSNIGNSASNAITAASKFLKQLAGQIGQAGYTLEQYNQDAASILERTLAGQTKGKALLDFVSEDTIGTSLLEGLANILGLQLNQLVNVTTGEVTGILTDHLIFNTNTGSYEILGSFESFVDALNKEYGNVIDKTSLQYIDALKSFNERKINLHNKIEKAIVDSIVGIDKAKPGDWINLTEVGVLLSNKLLKYTELDENGVEKTHRKTALYALNEELFKYGAELSEGILKLSDNANLLGIASTLLSITGEAGLELKDGLEEIADAILNVLQSYTNAIKKGISGGLSNTDAADLSTKAADLGINKIDFTKTAEGLKLSLHSAIELYTKLKLIDSLQGKLVFDELNKSLQESNEHYNSISAIEARIVELRTLKDTADPTKKELYAAELALAEEIRAVRSTTEDSSFNFMSNKIPGAQNNPINYFENWASAIHTFNDALKAPGTYTKDKKSYKSGFVDYDFWYNLVTEMNNIAGMGQDIEFAGVTLNGSLERASELILKGADSLVVTDTGEVKVALKGMALNFSSGADAFSSDVTTGIQAMAKSLVKMLDGMILLLETVVAMEKLGDIEGAEDGTIDLTDLFPKFNTEGVESAVLENTLVINWINNTLLGAAEDSNIGLFIRNVELNGENLHTLLTDAVTNGKELSKENAEALTTFINSLYQMYKSDKFDLNNIYASMQEVMGSADFSAVIPMGDSTLIIENGTTLLQTKEGKYKTPSGKEYDANLKDLAIAETALELKGVKDVTFDATLGLATGTLTIGLTEFKMVGEKDGTVTYTANGITATSLTDYIQLYIDKDMAHGGGQFHTAEQLQFELEVQYGIAPLNSFTYKGLSDEIHTKLEKALASGKLTEVDAVIKANPVLSLLQGLTGEEISKLLGLDSIKTIVDNSLALEAIDAVEKALDNLKDKTIYLKTYDTTYKRVVETDEDWAAGANGTIGLAKARGTLMGELGPELVVSNGRYFVAGQNGPEMVDLADDAIVFNHLQTKSLLEKGTSPDRGKAITNERNAVAFATGNINGGPAMASASAMLEAVKQLRAQWNALAGLSVKDLAGKGGGGGGGGGDPKAFIKDLEKWYNWLQKIAQLEKDINYEEALRNRIASDFEPNGYEYYQSLRRTLKDITSEVFTQQNLLDSQSEYFDKRRAEMNSASNPFTALYTFDENGQLKYKDGALAKLSDLVGRNSLTGEANYTAKEQYDKLVEWGYGDYMKYDSSGNEIKQDNEGWENTAIKAFWDKIDADREEMLSLHDSLEDLKVNIENNAQKRNEILKAIEDNLISVEGRVLNAIVDSRQRAIDDSKKERDAIEKANNALIDGLSNALSKEREMYEQNTSNKELTSLLRQLAILLRSGGSAAEIASLQDLIADRQLNMYFDAQLQQIDALQEASNKLLERLDRQIELEEETLEYLKAHGMLWEQVYDVLSGNAEEIKSFITTYDSKFWSMSETSFGLEVRQVELEVELFKALTEDETAGGDVKLLEKNIEEEAKTEEGNTLKTGGTWKQDDTGWWYEHTDGTYTQNNWEKIDDKWYHFDKNGYMQTGWIQDSDKWYYLDDEGAMVSNTTRTIDGKDYKFDTSGAWIDESENKSSTNNTSTTPTLEYSEVVADGAEGHHNEFHYSNGVVEKGVTVPHVWPSVITNGAKCTVCGWLASSYTPTSHASGGLVKRPTLSWLAEKGEEAVLNAEQTKVLKNDILGHSNNSLINLLQDFRAAYGGINGNYSSINNNSSVIIEHAEVNMRVDKLADSYDSARAADDVMKEMLNIARKTNTLNRVGR